MLASQVASQVEKALTETDAELKDLRVRHARMTIDLKDALTEIEERGRHIAAIEGCARGFVDFVAAFTETTLNTLPPQDRQKLKQLRGQARASGLG